jgi:hypothetical protein
MRLPPQPEPHLPTCLLQLLSCSLRFFQDCNGAPLNAHHRVQPASSLQESDLPESVAALFLCFFE